MNNRNKDELTNFIEAIQKASSQKHVITNTNVAGDNLIPEQRLESSKEKALVHAKYRAVRKNEPFLSDEDLGVDEDDSMLIDEIILEFLDKTGL